MRFVPLFLILLLLDIYSFQAFRVIAQHWSSVARWMLYAFFWSIPIIAIVGILLASNSDVSKWNKHIYTFFRAFIFIAYFSKLLIAALLFADDIRRGGMKLFEVFAGDKGFNYNRSVFLSQLGLVIGSIPFLSLTYGILRNPYRYKVFRQKVTLNRLPAALKGLRIVQISDIHSGSFTFKEPVKRAIELINAQKPDLVFFTGDLVNNVASEMDNFIDVFDKINAKYGVYSVLGNHDYGDYVRWASAEEKQQNLENLKDTHRKMGWDILINENRLLDINNEKVAIIGVENYSAHPRFPKYGDLAKAYQGTEDAKIKLLLSHDPTHWKDQVIPAYPDIDITFSGHTHGMQFGVEIPGWFKWSPVQYVYKQWAGLYQQGEQYLHVNRGLGFLGYPGRVGILPEITVMEVENGEM